VLREAESPTRLEVGNCEITWFCGARLGHRLGLTRAPARHNYSALVLRYSVCNDCKMSAAANRYIEYLLYLLAYLSHSGPLCEAPRRANPKGYPLTEGLSQISAFLVALTFVAVRKPQHHRRSLVNQHSKCCLKLFVFEATDLLYLVTKPYTLLRSPHPESLP
jgi:hypothetical protein